jgi:hypothetical protein
MPYNECTLPKPSKAAPGKCTANHTAICGEQVGIVRYVESECKRIMITRKAAPQSRSLGQLYSAASYQLRPEFRPEPESRE